MLIFAVMFGVLAMVMFKFYDSKQSIEQKKKSAKLEQAKKAEIEQAKKEIEAKYKTTKVVAAGATIDENSELKPDMFKPQEILETSLTGDMILWAASHEIKLEGMVTTIPMFPDEPIRKSKLTGKKKVPKLSYKISPGMRAVSIKTDNLVENISGFVKQGDYVDIIAVFTGTGRGPANAQPFSRTILQNIKVLAMGNKFFLSGEAPVNDETQADPKAPGAVKGPPAAAAPGAAVQPKIQTGTPAKTVTLELSLKDAERLILAMNKAKLQLVLRNPSFKDFEATKGYDETMLMADPTEEDRLRYEEKVRRQQGKEIIIEKGSKEIKRYVDRKI
jgi:Flp pilus assembly protein CpaB